MKILITESQILFLRRRKEEIDEHVSLALKRLDAVEYNYKDFVDEVVWQVFDEFSYLKNHPTFEEIKDFVVQNYLMEITHHYERKNNF